MRRSLFFSLLLSSGLLHAQRHELYGEERDLKPYYFGLTLSGVSSHFKIDPHPAFLHQDSIYVAEPLNTSGISLRLVAALNLTYRFELRFNPGLIFTERPVQYILAKPDMDNQLKVKKSVESIVSTFPLLLKFKSDRIGNFRVYMLGGVKADIDMASNAKVRKLQDALRIEKMSYGIEAGMGFNFYRKSVTISPEIKISNGLNNLHSRNENLNYSRIIDGIHSRMIIFSLHLEG